MATVTGLTAEATTEMLNETIISAEVVDGILIFTTRGGATFDAGNVVGPAVGGLAGSVFAKTSDDDYDAVWTRELDLDTVDIHGSSAYDRLLALWMLDEEYPRVGFRLNKFSMADGNVSPFGGTHVVGAMGEGNDAGFLIERLASAAIGVHIQDAQRGRLASENTPFNGTPVSLPLSSVTFQVEDYTELPSTDDGPHGLGRGFLIPPTWLDTFTRVNSTTTMGSGYSAQGGSVWGINDTKAYCVSGGTVSRVLHDTEVVRHRITVTTSGSEAHWNGSGIIFNYVDANNFLYVVYDSALDTWIVRSVIAGVDEQLFNSGVPTTHALTISAEYKDGIVSVKFGDDLPRKMELSVTEGTRCGFMTPNSGPVGNTVRWDDLKIEKESIATWTGKSGGGLTGFSCAEGTDLVDFQWAVRYEDPSDRALTRWSDADGSPIGMFYTNGGMRLTNGLRFVSWDGMNEIDIDFITEDPEGVVTATPGAIRITSTGGLWLKTENDDDTGWSRVFDLSQAPTTIFETYTADHEAELSDAGKTILMDSASANEFKIMANATVPYPIGTKMWVIMDGVGLTTIAADVGVTINSLGGNLDLAGQFGKVELEKQATNVWYASGDLA